MASTYVRNSNRKLVFTGELLNEARQRILNGEARKSGRRSWHKTLRKRMKVVSSEQSPGASISADKNDFQADMFGSPQVAVNK
jgi:hypothetical protein